MDIVGPAGRLETLWDRPQGLPRAGVVLAHPHPQYGGTMHSKVVYRTAKALAAIGCLVLRFNFRGVGRSGGTFDDGPGEREDFATCLAFMADRQPGLELWAGGYSFGSWIACEVGAGDDRVSVLLGISLPVNHYEYTRLRSSTKPKFLIHGERDEICSLRRIRAFYGELEEPKELVVIDGADHLFDGKVSELGDAVVDLLDHFTARGHPA